MSNPFSNTEIPGMNAMGDTLSFVKNLWGNMQVPGMVAPPMSVDELDKKIQDLKTVESWLTVNMNMLRGTIQALEVQRGTLATLKSLGESFAQHMQKATNVTEGTASPFSTGETSSAAGAPFNANSDWPMPPVGKTTTAAEPAAPPPEKAETIPEKTADKAPAADSTPPFANPTAWWGLLQDQFKQAVSKAMENDIIPKDLSPLVTPAATKKEASATPSPAKKASAAPRQSATTAKKASSKPASPAKPPVTAAKPASKATRSTPKSKATPK